MFKKVTSKDTGKWPYYRLVVVMMKFQAIRKVLRIR